MRQVVRLFALLLVSACAAPSGTPVASNSPAPNASGSLPPSPWPSPHASGFSPVSPTPTPLDVATMLSGRWAYGKANEPPMGEVFECQVLKTISVQNGVVQLTEADGGCPEAIFETARGSLSDEGITLVGMRLTSTGEVAVSYDLRYDPASGHLRGTRDGEPIWLAPAKGGCTYPASLCYTNLRGDIYDEAGHLVPDVTVNVHSTNMSNPFDETIETPTGHWASLRVPTGIMLEVTVSKVGWMTRSRTKIMYFNTTVRPNRLNFGGAPTPEDPDATAYPLLPDAPSEPSSD